MVQALTRGAVTVITLCVLVTPPHTAVRLLVPAATPLTTPALLTAAMVGVLLLQEVGLHACVELSV